MRQELPNDDLQRLVAASQRGDETAFEQLLRSQLEPLDSYVRRHTPPELAHVLEPNDVLQDVFLDAFRRFGQFRAADESSARRWLLTIAHNRIVDHLRHFKARKRGAERSPNDPVDIGESQLVGLLEELAVYQRTPSQSAMSHERHFALQHAIELLDPDYRDAIRFRYVEGQPVSVIAKRLGRSEGAIHMLCNRALKELRRALASNPEALQ